MLMKKKIDRVDLQVSCLITGIVFCVVACVYIFHYSLTHKDMIHSLEAQCNSIYEYLQSQIVDDTFSHINTIEDEQSQYYINLKEKLEYVRKITGVKYLYTAKENRQGQLIYLVDGLDISAADFRHAGDLIEEEIHSDLRRALNGEVVLPQDILVTSWGNIFICYYPIYNEARSVIGVLGIEFDATHQYQTYQTLKIGTPFIGLAACAAAVLLAVIMFRKISNPSYKDMANTDFLTNCNNRNAFELRIKNLSGAGGQENIRLYSIDLNGLKGVNDSLGHTQGDRYIRKIAQILTTCLTEGMLLYRTGGDEFSIIDIKDAEERLSSFERRLREAIAAENMTGQLPFSLSISLGSARHDKNRDQTLMDTYRCADARMYKQKEAYYLAMQANTNK